MKKIFVSMIAAVCGTAMAHAQAFINLDFEQATIQPIDDDPLFVKLEWSLAAPGWSHRSAYDSGIVYYLSTHLGITPAYLLVDYQSPIGGDGPLQGNYSFHFRNGFSGEESEWVNAFIAQTGLIPDDATSIQLQATGLFGVVVNDMEIPLINLGGNAYIGDIAAFSGTVAELKIVNLARPIPEEVSAGVFVDAISFMPEPNSVALFGIGLASVCAYFRFRRHETGV